eukprot:NODE_6753_length_846_cov_50.900415_g6155_i0.p1 GENE.NODE_6753_length_846_cov_50.900415_g6155_i0~~NODE_6753_length_846_cov_50.900415_g6155_i0.p1  ORF type:complete len:225 (+),score=1.46 NODE_6753_length_846_cov_50.900415_g6155_i0:63-737(+)
MAQAFFLKFVEDYAIILPISAVGVVIADTVCQWMELHFSLERQRERIQNETENKTSSGELQTKVIVIDRPFCEVYDWKRTLRTIVTEIPINMFVVLMFSALDYAFPPPNTVLSALVKSLIMVPFGPVISISFASIYKFLETYDCDEVGDKIINVLGESFTINPLYWFVMDFIMFLSFTEVTSQRIFSVFATTFYIILCSWQANRNNKITVCTATRDCWERFNIV